MLIEERLNYFEITNFHVNVSLGRQAPLWGYGHSWTWVVFLRAFTYVDGLRVAHHHFLKRNERTKQIRIVLCEQSELGYDRIARSRLLP